MPFVDGGYALELHGGRYRTEAELESFYPDGDYVFQYTAAGTGSVEQAVTLGNSKDSGSGLPAVPIIALSQGGRTIAPGEVNPDLDLEVSWSPFKEGGADPLGIMDDLLFVITVSYTHLTLPTIYSV